MTRRFLVLLAAGVMLVVYLVAPERRLAADAPDAVAVTNFPDVQTITGDVAVSAPIPASRFESHRAVVSPGSLANFNELTNAGTIDTAGFSSITIGLAGIAQSATARGTVGVLLVPDTPEIMAAFRDHSVPQLPLQLEAQVAPSASGLFESEPTSFRLLFPRYRVFFYNTTSKTTEVSLYATVSTS